LFIYLRERKIAKENTSTGEREKHAPHSLSGEPDAGLGPRTPGS